MKRIIKLYKEYRFVNARIASFSSKMQTFKSALFSLLITLLIAFIPMIIFIQLFIIPRIEMLLAFLILFTLIVSIFLYYLFYFKLLGYYNGKIKEINVKPVFYIEPTFISVILLILGTTFIILLF
ncbi:hypothetical protein LJC17_00815 [Acholeplasma sp. OttesenSCG-928-E16]|nr:hypothetical protein [Acholeplasma sp. OttesenSCG-928-E16]